MAVVWALFDLRISLLYIFFLFIAMGWGVLFALQRRLAFGSNHIEH